MMFSMPSLAISGQNPFKSAGLSTAGFKTPFNGDSGFSGVNMAGWKPASFQDKGFIDKTQKSAFENVLGTMVKDMDVSMKEPEQLMNRYLTVGDIDVHDVMMANAKSDITINVASQVATKIIQAYERIQQIQV
jgi:flagellar hook-basal body complex protein FliE